MMDLGKSSKNLSREVLGLLLVLSLALIVYVCNLDGWLLEDDENKYIYAAWRVAQGEVPGEDFLIAQPPLFLYAGAIAIKLCGGPSLHALYALRSFSVTAILVTALFAYLTARTIWNARAGWLAMFIFVLNGQVFVNGRLFRPDTFMLVLTTIGTYLVVLAVARQKRWLLGGAGFLFGLAAAIKLFGLLAWGGCILYLLHRLWAKETSVRDALADLLLLGVPAVAVVGASYGLFYWLSPRLIEGVLGSHIQQSKLGLLLKLINPLVLYSDFVSQQFAFLLLIPVVDQLRRRKRSLAGVYLWQLPTALNFFFWGRSLYPRHLLYLVPSLAALMGWLLDAGLRWAENLLVRGMQPAGRLENWLLGVYGAFRARGLTGVAIGGLLTIVVVQPLIGTILPAITRQDPDTLALVDYIVAHTDEDDYVLAEYAGLNFFARRPSIYYGPYISWGVASTGVLTSEHLIGEIEAKHVHMVLFNVGPLFQLSSMPDFDTFRAYVRQHYDFMATFQREDQTFEIYLTPELGQEAVP